MRTILVDDEPYGLKSFEIECAGMEDIEIVGKFQNPLEALALAKKQRVDLAFLDIEMPEMNGLELSDKLREIYPDIIVIFVSAYDEYMVEAMSKRKADHFLIKPYTAEDVCGELNRAKLLSARQKNRVSIHTFGNFEVYLDGKPMLFTSNKAKEVLAVLVDAAGESVTTEDAFTKMWETRQYSNAQASNFRHALQKLQATLLKEGVENILHYFPQARAIRKDMVECDYFDMLDEKPEVARAWNGEYMTQYTWGEYRKGKLFRIKKKYDPDADDIWGE